MVRMPHRQLPWEMLARLTRLRVDDIIILLRVQPATGRQTGTSHADGCLFVFSLGPIDLDSVYDYLVAGGFQWSIYPDTQA